MTVKKTGKGQLEEKARSFSSEMETYFILQVAIATIADKTKQLQIIHSSHGNKLGWHFGRDKTREKNHFKVSIVNINKPVKFIINKL